MIFKCFLVFLCTNVYLAWKLHNYISETLYTDEGVFIMNPFSNSFEKKWTFIFLFMYVLIMLPFPWYYATEYIPSFWGTPLFIFGWIFHGLVVIILIFLWCYYYLFWFIDLYRLLCYKANSNS